MERGSGMTDDNVYIWVGDFDEYEIPEEFQDIQIRKDGWPDQRFTKGRGMVKHFKALDRRNAA